MKIAENTVILPIGGQGAINLVLTWDDDNLVLIDAGFPNQTDAIAKAIADEGFNAESLTHLIITHQDWDHIGCINDLRVLAPKLRVLAHEEEAPYIDGRKTPIKLAARLAEYDNLSDEMKERCDWQKEYYANNKIIIDETLRDGQVLPLCGGIEVVHTPGHTPGHIVLHLKQSGIMVCGDACNIKDGQLVGANPVHTFDMGQAEASLDKIKSRNPSGVVAYHGGYLNLED
jgi:glyoxylase-like metal-dependent hydrolase (beta-lactamase superfamily II)